MRDLFIVSIWMLLLINTTIATQTTREEDSSVAVGPLKVEWVAVLEHPDPDATKVASFLEGDFAARAARLGLSVAKKKRIEGTGKTLMLFVDFKDPGADHRQNFYEFSEGEGRGNNDDDDFVASNFFSEEARRLSDPELINDLATFPSRGDGEHRYRLEGEASLHDGDRDRKGVRLTYFKNAPISAGPGFAVHSPQEIMAIANDGRGGGEKTTTTVVQQEIKKRRRNEDDNDESVGVYEKCKGVQNVWGLDRIDQRDLPLDGLFCRKPPEGATYVAPIDNEARLFHLFILDTGIDEMDGRGVRSRFQKRVEYDHSHYDPDGAHFCDCNGHGTHVAGSAASYAYGVLGWKDSASSASFKLRSIKILDCDGYGDLFSLADGLLEVEKVLEKELAAAAAKNVQLPLSKPMGVVNLSLGARMGRGKTVEALEDIMRRIWKRFGILFVVSAGNHDQDACDVFPANVMEYFVLTVGSTGPEDARSRFSNYGRCVDVHAPGSYTLSFANDFGRSHYYYNEDVNGESKKRRSPPLTPEGTTIMSGTSMSAGYVSGAYIHWLSALYELPSNEDDERRREGEEYWSVFVNDFKKTSFVKGRIDLQSGEGSRNDDDDDDDNNWLLSVPKKTIKMKWSDYRGQLNEEEEEEETNERRVPGQIKWWTPFSTLFGLGASLPRATPTGLLTMIIVYLLGAFPL